MVYVIRVGVLCMGVYYGWVGGCMKGSIRVYEGWVHGVCD